MMARYGGMRRWLWGSVMVAIAVAVFGLWLFGFFQPNVATAPPGEYAFSLEPVASGFSQPVQVIEAGGELVVIEQGGLVKSLDGTVVLDLEERVGSGYERGLLSALWHDGWFTHYTDNDGDTVLSSWQAGAETILWTHTQPYPNHNGGMIAIGPDGHLYMALGDGGLAGDPHGHGQDTDTHLGGILRFDVSVPGEVSVPLDNPFADGGAPYLFHYGLRNPWRFSFDNGDMWIGDVGQGNVEEISFAPAGSAGLNFGWSKFEGSHRFQSGSAPDHVGPVAQYDHDGGHCSVTGGEVVRDGGPMDGVYVFGDFCTGQLWTYDGALRRAQDTDLQISSFGRDAAGTVYIVDYGGAVYAIKSSE